MLDKGADYRWSGKDSLQVAGDDVRFTHPDKVLYPETGTTKLDVLEYYLQIAHLLIPQASWRPATRKRWVGGVGTAETPGKSFFHKNLGKGAPAWLPTAQIEHKKRVNTYPLVNNPAVLAWLAQVAALEIHTPQWRFNSDLARMNPDRLVIDLDPGPNVSLADTARAAITVRDKFDGAGQRTYPVTSGSKGIHLYVPLDGRLTSADASGLAKKVASDLEEEFPDQFVSSQKKSLREGRVLVDWSQNNWARTTVVPYSLRGRLHPFVAAPRTWAEMEDPDLTQLDYREVLRRAAEGLNPMKDLGWKDSEPPAATYSVADS